MTNQTENLPLEENKYTFAAASDSVKEGEMIDIFLGKETVVLARVDGSVYAVDGICSHAYSEMVDGELEDHCLYCPLHFACFDIRDGSVLEGPAVTPLSVYDVMEQDGSIWIKALDIYGE
ncbi:ferredoxin [Oceanobacillus oncorhynchi subsp. incaldanensis]|uniref:Naphthalene 1,2-dioxygenase/salicylate 5-hydroxylase systems, ferredoxin component n=1 Tax=Oceanobacillus oncorhynchi TaxID=545501 RepID=A0A0A1MCH0_9BACI|nr:non-heme iron oxygenase ferredoxin subunit [Oceanobacillus oncorhynchi]UUI41546.1 non-heme iron oxygenase ferredoxin subunit [Oceanobacillus oncorhynchi]GIO17680.1 ferredoxin [Oceanobacillus oncorhynchi subsp. incaldanensis]CEI83060.1 Naphthalene 1,2-dioxygenase/salicylate 5-hydroxylase systems, ferredoxin component [Oceanobacillus oncorhynchi]